MSRTFLCIEISFSMHALVHWWLIHCVTVHVLPSIPHSKHFSFLITIILNMLGGEGGVESEGREGEREELRMEVGKGWEKCGANLKRT